ncbi:MAG: L-aspartate dehydrogenase [Candidatus Tectimicrobiota bacterium]|nr:MAG: L-aspartate dehydrogenase [Candidatus Tectomicrobia bacterium]
MPGQPRHIGIVGCGTIGRAIARAIDDGTVIARLVALHSRDEEKARAFAASLQQAPPVVSLDELIARADLVVEAATQAALATIAPRTLSAGKDLMVLSVGALLEHPEWPQLAARHGCRLYVPSGAIVGLDGVKGACVGQVASVTITTRKPPRGLAGAPYLVAHGIDVLALQEATVVFEGTAREACKGFPANVNVAAALSLAGVGPERTRIRIIADPQCTRNTHDIEVVGEFGRLVAHVENVPSETNPRTGKLSYLSAIALLKELTQPVRYGT